VLLFQQYQVFVVRSVFPLTYNLGFDLLNKYFSFISKLDEANAPLPDLELKTNNNITDLNASIEEISDIIQILHPNKASEPDVISHKMLKLCPSKIALPLQIIIQ
jgi:hypothetical protein